MGRAAALLLSALLLAGCDRAPPPPARAPTGNAAAAAPAAPVVPSPSSRVVDQADLLPTEQEAELNSSLAALEQRTTDQVAILTLPSLDGRAIEPVATELFNQWGLGQRDRDNGVLLMIAPNERKVRIEVGFGLEAILTDERAAEIIDQDILPHLRDAQYQAGIMAGAESIISTLLAHADAPRVGR